MSHGSSKTRHPTQRNFELFYCLLFVTYSDHFLKFAFLMLDAWRVDIILNKRMKQNLRHCSKMSVEVLQPGLNREKYVWMCHCPLPETTVSGLG